MNDEQKREESNRKYHLKRRATHERYLAKHKLVPVRIRDDHPAKDPVFKDNKGEFIFVNCGECSEQHTKWYLDQSPPTFIHEEMGFTFFLPCRRCGSKIYM